jgi:large conductance mechanosensitive channel
MKDFKQFLLRGNVIDLAVGIVLGAAFGAVVTAFVAGFLTPIIALLAGRRASRSSPSPLGGIRAPRFRMGDS